MVNGFAVVICERDGYGDEVTVSCEGVEAYGEYLFSFKRIIEQVNFSELSFWFYIYIKNTPTEVGMLFIGSIF